MTAGTAPARNAAGTAGTPVPPGAAGVPPGTASATRAARTLRRQVEHADTDASGVVHFARYPVFLETAALDALYTLGVDATGLPADGLPAAGSGQPRSGQPESGQPESGAWPFRLDPPGSGRGVPDQDVLDLVVSDLRMRYAAPAHFRDQLSVAVRLDHLGAAQIRVAGEIRLDAPAPAAPEPGSPEAGGRLLAAGALTFAFVDRASGRAVAVPPPVRASLEEW